MENLGDQPKSRLVKVIQELAGSNPEVERRVESLLTSMVLREQLIKQLDKVEKLDTICPEDIYTSGWLSGYISHLPDATKYQLEKIIVYLTTHSPYDDLEVRAMYLQWKSDVGADSRGMPNNLHANAIRDMCAEHCNMQCPEDIDVLQRLLLNSFDRLKVGFISFHDFVMGMGSLHRGNKKTKRSMAFGALDCENNGYVTKQELMQAFRVLARAAAAVRQPDALVWPREAEDRAAQAAGRLFEEAVPGSDAPMSFEQYTQMTQRHMRHKARLDHFVAEFNKSPRKAIAGLQLPPPEVAKLLLSPNLSAQALGEYLGSPTASESGVLAAFAQQFPMEGVSLYGALQTFVGAFRLPGEAQCIDRIIEAFAAAYWAQNPAFPCVGGRDTLYVLAFSLVMLSTDLHNPNVAEKMTPGQFLRNNAGIDDGADLPAPTLHALYTDVQRGPLRLKGSCKPVLVQLVQVIASNTLPDTIVGLHCEAVAALAQQPVPSVEDDNGA